MTPRLRSVFVVRPPGPVLVLAWFLLLTLGSGCSHRRATLRPIYAAPATIIPADPCPPGAVGPGCAAGDASVTGARLAPLPGSSAPLNGGEPVLEPVTPSGADSPPVVPPEARRDGRLAPARRAALRSVVEPFVNDPNDLFQPPQADRPWRYVVLHHSDTGAGGYAQIDRDHRTVRGWNGCGYHFVIGNGTESPDGQIEVAGRWADQKAGAHCRDGKTADINEYGIGICLVGDFDQAPPTPRQVEASRALVAYLQDRYAIPSEQIGTHALLAGRPTACPGRHFPAEAILGSRTLGSRSLVAR